MFFCGRTTSMPQKPRLRIIVVGTGNIACYWLTHFATRLPPGVSVHGVSNSRVGQCVTEGNFSPPAFGVDAPTRSVNFDSRAWVVAELQRLAKQTQVQAVVLDLTASKEVSRWYPEWIGLGAHIISANKYAGSAAPDYYQRVQQALKVQQKLWLYNTTVGAGLPIQSAINERLSCCDSIHSLEGNFSGSLSWVFQQYRPGDSFSDWLRKAAELGMTEPDPRVDLSGMDVARKLLILAREAWPADAMHMELKAMEIANLVPPSLRQVPLAEFWRRSDELDEAIAGAAKGEQFHYLGQVERTENGFVKAAARLHAIHSDSPYAHLAPGNANFIIRSAQYADNPLVIQGPGAGREVTAAGVHRDVLTLWEAF